MAARHLKPGACSAPRTSPHKFARIRFAYRGSASSGVPRTTSIESWRPVIFGFQADLHEGLFAPQPSLVAVSFSVTCDLVRPPYEEKYGPAALTVRGS